MKKAYAFFVSEKRMEIPEPPEKRNWAKVKISNDT